MADHITHHPCGASIRADIGALVEHLAICPKTDRELWLVCRRLIQTLSEAARVETPVSRPSRKTPTETTETRDLTPAEMHAMHRDGEGDSLRDIARLAGVAPETVRRRIAKWKGGES